MKEIGRYEILETIGKGGMGEVLLAYDPICKRKIALKKIKTELGKNEMIKKRFLKEAKIASRLTHPSIVPIYSIHIDEDIIYYTMPYVKGKTLKHILEKDDELKNSIPNLIYIFLHICEAVSYIHSKNVLHRDLKPNNIIVGKHGEVLILDWGIANFIDENKPEKIEGTVAFMAPEKAKGEPSSISTDIYSLGVILYQILTLSPPFQRHNLAYFKKFIKDEKLIDPLEKSPYRNIPHILSEITKKCLNPNKEKRYQTVEQLIKDIKKFIEGKPKWIFSKNLNIKNKKDWVFNENIFLAKHTAITQSSDFSKWANVMIAKTSIWKNIKITTKILLKKSSEGIGFLISIPKQKDRFLIDDGYSIWIEKNCIQLIRCNALIMEVKKDLKNDRSYDIRIEKEENNLYFFIDDILILSHSTHIPLTSNYIGIFYRDLNFDMDIIKIFSSSSNALVNCLAIPDAFLIKKYYDIAYKEYKRINSSFPGRKEGIQALFRAGITLLEKAKTDKEYFQKALEEFENLRKTPGAPLEYLGKSLVYQATSEHEEEAKCLELAIRKFSDCPLLSAIKEHIFYRIHESALQNREAAYRLILIALLHIPSLIKRKDIDILIHNLKDNLEKIYFLLPSEHLLAIDLAFRLNKKITLMEILLNTKDQEDKENIFFALLELEEFKYVKKYNKDRFINYCAICDEDKDVLKYFFKKDLSFDKKISRALIYIITHFLDKKYKIPKEIFFINIHKNYKKNLTALYVRHLLQEKNFKEAEKIFSKYSKELLSDENFILFPLYGIYLFIKGEKETAIKHFSQLLEIPYPKTYSLISYYLTKKLKNWEKKAFFFEKKELKRQINLLN